MKENGKLVIADYPCMTASMCNLLIKDWIRIRSHVIKYRN